VVVPGRHKVVSVSTTRGYYSSEIRTNSDRLLIVTEPGAVIKGLENLAVAQRGTDGKTRFVLLERRIPQRWERAANGPPPQEVDNSELHRFTAYDRRSR
jgi:hypothetical protein